MIYILIFFMFIVFAVYVFTVKRKNTIAFFPEHWGSLLEKNVLFYQKLSLLDKAKFRKRVLLFLNTVYIEGVKTDIEDLDKILIASSAIIPLFGFKNWRYNNLSVVIVYPDTFNEALGFSELDENRRILGMVGTGRFENQMLLSKKAVRLAFNNKTDKHNTPVHEFVHLLDKMDGDIDGIPERFLGKEFIAPWLELMHKEMEMINNDASDIRKYGGTSQAEFFAVASEYFFERPKLFKRKHPELYRMLSLCFRQPKSLS